MSDFEGSFGLPSDFSIPINNTVYKIGATSSFVFAFLLLLLLILGGFILFYVQSNQPSPEIIINREADPVSPFWCEQCGHGKYQGGKCHCSLGFTGPNCTLEEVDPTYYDLGTPANPLEVDVIESPIVNQLSGGNNSCTQACTGMEDCIGVQYFPTSECDTGNRCFLLRGVKVPADDFLSFSPDTQSQIYINDPQGLVFVNRIFLVETLASFPPHYPRIFKSPGYRQLIVNEVAALDFFPTIAVQNSNLLGIYSLNPFTKENIQTVSLQADTYVTRGNPQLPSSWQGKTIYVGYFVSSLFPF